MDEPARPRPPAPRPPDSLFVLIAGFYVGALLAPNTLALASRVVTGPGPLYVVLLAAATGGTVVGALAVWGRDGLAERLGHTAMAWLLVAVPVIAVAGVLVVETTMGDVVREGDVLSALLGGFGAALLGFVLVSMAKTRYAAWVLEGATVEATWSAPWPRQARRRVWYVAGTTIALGGVGFAVGAYLGRDPLRILGQILVPVGAVLATTGRSLTYRATDRGLEIRAPAARRLVSWSDFAGYRLRDEALVLVRPSPFRQSIRCDRTAIADPAALSSALDASLDRLS